MPAGLDIPANIKSVPPSTKLQSCVFDPQGDFVCGVLEPPFPFCYPKPSFWEAGFVGFRCTDDRTFVPNQYGRDYE